MKLLLLPLCCKQLGPNVTEWTLSLPVAYVPPAVRIYSYLTFVMIPSIPGFVTCFSLLHVNTIKQRRV